MASEFWWWERCQILYLLIDPLSTLVFLRVALLKRFELPHDFQVKDGQQRFFYAPEKRTNYSGEIVVPVSMLVRSEHCHPEKPDVEIYLHSTFHLIITRA